MSGPPPMDPSRYRFFQPSQIANIAQFVARLGMIEDIEVLRRTEVSVTDPSRDYGDDEIDYIETTDARRHWVKGWIHATPSQVQQVDTGAIVTVNTYSFRCPVGTDILPGDELTINGDTYILSDTTAENTWKALVSCNLRKRD